MKKAKLYFLITMSLTVTIVMLNSCVFNRNEINRKKTGDVFINIYGISGKRNITLIGENTSLTSHSAYFRNVLPGKYTLEVQTISDQNTIHEASNVNHRKSTLTDIVVSEGFLTLGNAFLHCEYDSHDKWRGEKILHQLMNQNGEVAGRIESFEDFKKAFISNKNSYPLISLSGGIGIKLFKQVTITDSTGEFNFKQVNPGTYHLTAEYGSSFRHPDIINIIILPNKTAMIIINPSLNVNSSVLPENHNPCNFKTIEWQKGYQ